MLFHITHVHTPETCPGKDPEKMRNTFGKMISDAEEIGVKVVGVWVDGPAHTVYFVVETDSAEKLFNLHQPTLDIASADIRPVQDGTALFKKRYGAS